MMPDEDSVKAGIEVAPQQIGMPIGVVLGKQAIRGGGIHIGAVLGARR